MLPPIGATAVEAAKDFRRLKAKGQLPALRVALITHRATAKITGSVAQQPSAA